MMRTHLVVSSILVVVFFAFCKSPKEASPQNTQGETPMALDTIPYSIAQNYFVKNTVDSIPDPKIETEEEFRRYFGFATTMGQNGKPSVIDFSNQFAIAVVLSLTDLATTIKPVGLDKGKDKSIQLRYRIEIGSKQSYTSRPFLLLVVDRKFNGPLTLMPLN
jgi:hypothetical protein